MVGEAQVTHKNEAETNTGYNQSGNWLGELAWGAGVPRG